jgi:hypothetical protein
MVRRTGPLPARRTDDLPLRRREQELISASTDEHAVLQQLVELERSSERLDEIAMLCLNEAWESPDERDAVRAALNAARGRLSVIETSIIAISVMHGIYLIATGGKQSVRSNADFKSAFLFRGYALSLHSLCRLGPPRVAGPLNIGHRLRFLSGRRDHPPVEPSRRSAIIDLGDPPNTHPRTRAFDRLRNINFCKLRDAMQWFWDQYPTDPEQRAEITASPLRASAE